MYFILVKKYFFELFFLILMITSYSEMDRGVFYVYVSIDYEIYQFIERKEEVVCLFLKRIILKNLLMTGNF